MANNNSAAYEEDIDEAEEEALLKSDDETEPLKPKTATEEEEEEEEEESDLSDEAMPLEREEDNEHTDDDDDEEEKSLKDYNNKLQEVEQNPFKYDAYVELCQLAHATGDLDLIRKAYSKFASAYPLSSELWLNYLRTEVSVAQSPTEITKVEQLFRTAFNDYYAFDIALEFAEFATRCTNSAEVWQELLGTYGLHIIKGRQLFKKYRQQLQQQNADYINSYIQELKYPLNGMEDSYIEFKVLFEKNKANLAAQVNWEQVDRNYFKAKEHLQKVLPFETELSALKAHCHRERADIYQRYIKETDKFLDENVLQTIYERMVADCCLNENCWLTYVDFLQYRDKYERPSELQQLPVFQQSAEQVLQRALRNCTWSEKLYIKRILLMEERECSRDEVQEVLESSLTAGFQTPEPVVDIWMEYLTYLRRQTDFNDEVQCEILRKNFNLAWTILGQQWGVLADFNCEILKFWGRLEYGPLQDAKRGKELWTTVMKSSDNEAKSGLWVEFAQLEMRRDLENTRNLYKKALHAEGLDNPYVIISAWERFERCNGSIHTLKICKRDCSEFKVQYERKLQTTKEPKKATKRGPSGEEKERNQEPIEKKAKYPAKETAKTLTHNEMATEEHASQEIDTAKDHLRIFLSNLDYNLIEDDIREQLKELNIVRVDLVRSPNGRSRGFGYLELQSKADVLRALNMDRHMLQGRPMFVSSVLRDKEQRQKFKYSESIEPKKLFIKSLPHDATQSELETIFGAHGKLKDVRLVYHKSGKFKNIAYIEFNEEVAARKALLATNDMELRGHTICVAISAPPPKPSTTNASNITKMLGINNRNARNATEQKPRISLIPNAVRQKLAADCKAMPPPSVPNATTSNSNGTVPTVKSNADFRKMLLK